MADFAGNFQQRLADANGDLIEALHGHKCGPDCWHKARPKPLTEEEIKAASRRAARDMGAEARRDLIRAAARWARQRFL